MSQHFKHPAYQDHYKLPPSSKGGRPTMGERKIKEEMERIPELSEFARSLTPVDRLEFISLFFFEKFLQEKLAADLREAGKWAEAVAPYKHARKGAVKEAAPIKNKEKPTMTADEMREAMFGIPSKDEDDSEH